MLGGIISYLLPGRGRWHFKMNKETEALEFIRHTLGSSANPAVLCSFGKDSMVMLHLVRQVNPNIPVVFFKQPFFPKKYAFSNKVIEDWNLTVYDFPPVGTDHVSKGEEFDVINWYNVFRGALLYLPNGTHKPKAGEDFVCAIKDLLNKPTVRDYHFVWDTIFVGHKNNDVDTILGQTILKSNTVKILDMNLSLPIRNWSDKEIWDYTVKNNVPFNDRRYNKDDGFKEHADKTYNNDYLACCSRCLDNKEPPTVLCPKQNRVIKNISRTEEQNAEKIKSIFKMANYMENA